MATQVVTTRASNLVKLKIKFHSVSNKILVSFSDYFIDYVLLEQHNQKESRGGPCQHGFMCGCKQWSNDINESN